MRKLAVLAALAVTAAAWAVVFNEVEPNDDKANANVAAGLVAGDQLTGTSTSSSGTGYDYWMARTAPAPLGIYRHRLMITPSDLAWSASIRGLNQTGAPVDTAAGLPWDGVVGTPGTTDTTVQSTSSSTTPVRFSQWYGFGKSEQLFWRVNGTTATTVSYVVDYTSELITPIDIGSYAPGSIQLTTFNQGHTTDTDMWVYDSALSAIAGFGNDDESTNAVGGGPGTGATGRSFFARDYAPGVYYLALTTYNLANNMASASDDDFRTGALLDFADAVACSATSTNADVKFTISDSIGTTLQVPSTKFGAYDINWFKFTVTPEPTSLMLLALGALLRRR